MMIENWITKFKPPEVIYTNAEFRNPFNLNLHPRIRELLESARYKDSKTSLYEVCQYIADNRSWGEQHRNFLNNISVEEFESNIRNLETEKRKLVLVTLIDMCINRNAYENSFGPAIINFIKACKRIHKEEISSRCQRLIRLLFKDAKIEHLLDQ